MAVTAECRAYVLDQIGRIVPVSARSMFGGVGLYSEGLFFGLIDDDRVYLKVDDANRQGFIDVRSGPFRPYGEDARPMSYYELPADRLESLELLKPWIEGSIEVARRSKRRK